MVVVGVVGVVVLVVLLVLLLVLVLVIVVVFANGLETVRVKCHIFKVLRNGLLRYILYTCPNL